jgi:cation transport ATPase
MFTVDFVYLVGMKKLILLITIFFGLQLQLDSQILWIQIGVDGLSCKQCPRKIESAIRKLDFVESFKIDSNSTEGTITFKSGKNISIDKIAKTVVTTGFSLRYLKAGYLFDQISINEDECLQLGDKWMQFVKIKSTELNNSVTLTFLGKAFQGKSQYEQWKSMLIPKCKVNEQVYFVTL